MFSLKTVRLVAIIFAASSLFSCNAEWGSNKSWSKGLKPTHFPESSYAFDPDTLDKPTVELGRALFYDNILSSDSSISCGTCHSQIHAFAGHGTALSAGVDGRLGTRNTPGLSNLAWHESYMLDGGINHLELVPIAPITSTVEMNLSLSEALMRLNTSSYRGRFKKVFGADTINTKLLMKALTAFELTLVSADAKYDAVLLGEATFTEEEALGEDLFMARCASCHVPPLFSEYTYANNGLELYSTDGGRARITSNATDSGSFKIPSLRNAELTYPYMHDGSLYTLDAVLEHYSTGIEDSPNLDPRIEGPMEFTSQEKSALIAFIKTLTDHSLLTNPNLGEL